MRINYWQIMTMQNEVDKIKELEAIIALLREQLKVAKATIVNLQRAKWQDDRDYLDYEDRK